MRITFNEGFSNTPVIFAAWKDFVIAQVQLGNTSRLRDVIDGCRLAANRLAEEDDAAHSSTKWSVVEELLAKALGELPTPGESLRAPWRRAPREP